MKKIIAIIIATALSVSSYTGAGVAFASDATTPGAVPAESESTRPDAENTQLDAEGECSDAACDQTGAESIRAENISALIPESWDDDDPLNIRAYERIYANEAEGTGEDMAAEQAAETADSGGEPAFSAESDAQTLYASSALTTTWKTYTNSSLSATTTSSFTHDTQNTDGCSVQTGIDVSYHDGNIDWSKVKAAGIEFAIIRAGYRGYSNGSLNKDVKFDTYMKEASAAGIKLGVYFFSQALNTDEAVEEAEYLLDLVSGYKIDLQLCFDYEYVGTSSARLDKANLSFAKKTEIAMAFCARIEKAGYDAMLYSSSSWLVNELDGDAMAEKYNIWMARYSSYSYNASKDAGLARYSGQIDYWQCSSSAKVSGISTAVDLDYRYVSEAGTVVYDSASGKWVYQVNGEYDYTYTGVAKNKNGWWRVEKGVVNFSYTGLAKNQNGWWYIKKGKVDFSYNGVTNNQNGWWYVTGGKVRFDYTGVANYKNAKGWWYIKNGKVDFSTNTVAKNKNGWWYVTGGKVRFDYTGVANYKNAKGWWYIKNGKVDFSANTVAKNKNGWWVVRSGKVKFSYNGIAKNAKGWWYIKNGKVDFSYSGKVRVSSGTYSVKKGKVKR